MLFLCVLDIETKCISSEEGKKKHLHAKCNIKTALYASVSQKGALQQFHLTLYSSVLAPDVSK